MSKIQGSKLFGERIVRALALVLTLPALARAEELLKFDIAMQPLVPALKAFAEQSNMQLLYKHEAVQSATANTVVGRFHKHAALEQLLKGTGLEVVFMADDAATIRVRGFNETSGDISHARRAPRLAQVADTQNPDLPGSGARETKGTSSPNGAASQENGVQEIIVSARKQDERLLDVPGPVTAVDAAVLTSQSEVLLRDYYSKVPGLIVSPAVQTNQTVAIRGITTGTGNPTVAILIDDISYGASTNIGGGRFIPEVDPGDLARVEVLRGPQGTLYGASSLGGLLKYVTRDPSTEGFSGTVQMGLNSVRNGEDEGYNLRGSINAPLSDTWAIRASAFTRRDPGYVDNIRTGEDAVNETVAEGARVSTLWQPSDVFSMKVNALIQELEEDGQPFMGIGLSDFQQSQFIGSGWTARKTRAFSASLNTKLGNAEVISLTGYTMNDFSGSLDLGGTEVLGGFDGSKFTQEVRLSMPVGSRFEWLLGAFYTNEHSLLLQTLVTVDPTTGERLAVISSGGTPTTFKEYAAFSALTVNFTDRFDLQLGVREARIRQTFNALEPKTSALTYLITPRLRLTPDLMIYGRAASGYRPGGGNIVANPLVPPQYEPDETQNYEVGVKGDFHNGRLTIDTSVYYIDWKDIQFNLFTPGPIPVSYTSNGSRAHSQGVEVAVGLRPLMGLTIDGWVSWSDVVLTEDFPPLSTALGSSGDRLPFSSRFSGYLSLEQEFPLRSDLTGFVGGSLRHVGSRVGPFRASTLRQDFPEYRQIDLRAGLRRSSWSTDLYVTNVTDKRGALGGGLGSLPANAFIYTRPRTVGLSFKKDF